MEFSRLSKFIRHFSTISSEPIPPEHLVRFIRGHVVTPITSTLPTSPQKLEENVVKERVSQHFKRANLDGFVCDSPWVERSYPKMSSFWPNPLIHNSRLKPFYVWKSPTNTSSTNTPDPSKEEKTDNLPDGPNGTTNINQDLSKVQDMHPYTHLGDNHLPTNPQEKQNHPEGIQTDNTDKTNFTTPSNPENSTIPPEDVNQIYLNKIRLQNLWKYSNSHGVSWNKLDSYFFEFIEEKKKHMEDWKNHEEDILQFTSQKAQWIIMKKRKRIFNNQGDDLTALDKDHLEKLLKPRSLVKKLTRRLYFQYKSAYMSHWSEEKLIEYLKSKATDHMLKREEFERFYNGNITEIQNNEEDIQNGNKMDETLHTHFHNWDMEGVGKTRIKRFKEYIECVENKDK